MSETDIPEPEKWLASFGLSAFRPGQKEVIATVLEGRDCLCIMPTGGGKSLCYQLPAIMRPGVVLVISPLIALMKDQVDALQALKLRATYINSSLDAFEQRQRLAEMSAGGYDLVYVSPERLRSPQFLESLKPVTIQLLAIDESHCISEWGHDFRPDYARIGKFREKLGTPQTIALTATATPLVRADVIAQLRLSAPDVFITGFARPNLRFEVKHPLGREKNETLSQILDETPGSGIIYAATRKKCESIVEYLKKQQRRKVGLYHAGLLPDERRAVQDAFMGDQIPLIVATNAFGMGIDKRDLRVVVHYNMPGSLEAYYQESGRAGRDGRPSRCVLLYNGSDRHIQEFFIENSYPERDVVRRVYDFLRQQPMDPIELTQLEIKDALDLSLSAEGVGVCERLLEKCGVLERLDANQNLAQVKLDSELPTLVDLLPREARVQRRVLRELEREVDDRRREWVSFSATKLGAAVDLDRESLARALKELTKLSVLDYVPPFRGRAIHMIRRDCLFHKLEIDFAELERRKAAEMEKLDRVVSYAQSRRCRQREILIYFGDTQLTRCGECDNCRPVVAQSNSTGAVELAGAIQDERLVEAVRMVLSGVARTRGKVGKKLLARMLCGSRSAQISDLKLDQLSTFGLLDHLNQLEVGELIQALIDVKLLKQTELQRHRPVVELTELGGEVMRGRSGLPPTLALSPAILARVRSRRVAGLRATRTDSPAAGTHDLGSSRAVLAPPSPVAGDGDSDAGRGIDQLGRGAATGQAPHFDDCRDRLPTTPESSRERRATMVVDTPTSQTSYYWTWRLFQDGYSLAECLAIREIDQDTALDHLLRAAQDGRSVQLAWVVDSQQEEVLKHVVGIRPPAHLRSFVDRLPPGIGPPHVQLYCQLRQTAGTDERR